MNLFKPDQSIELGGLNYQIVKLLKQGSGRAFNEVWKFRADNKFFAAKFCLKISQQREPYIKREIEAYLKLRSSSFAKLCDYGVYSPISPNEIELDYFVLEFIEGPTLFDIIDSDNRFDRKGQLLDFKEAFSHARKLARILLEIENQELVYTDLKPGDIIVGERMVLLDLDSCLSNGTFTSNFEKLTTPLYSSPEISSALYSSGIFVARSTSTIFSYGSLLFELFTQVEVFSAENPKAAYERICQYEPPFSILTQRGVPQAVIEVIKKCLQKDPANRFQSFREVLNAFENI